MLNNSLFNYWKIGSSRESSNKNKVVNFNLNFGPQHPASHGVLRMILQMRGELIEKVDTHIGLLHRGSEKLIEDRNYLTSLPYFDRMDYVSVLSQEHAYCLAVEDLAGTTNYQSDWTQVRVVYDELTRILNHLMGVSTHSLDVGCMAPVFWAFEEREKIMEFYERVSGARLHAAFYRPNDITSNPVSKELFRDIAVFCREFLKRLMMMENKLAMSSIWKYRLSNIGNFTRELVTKFGGTGVLARSTGLKRDLRISFFETYANYYYLNIRTFITQNGDCYDRYLIRMREMAESAHIVLQVINKFNLNYFDSTKNNKKLFKVKSFDKKIQSYMDFTSSFLLKSQKNFAHLPWYISMEDLIHHFKYYSEGLKLKNSSTYKSIEAPKGEFGVFLVSDGSNKPFRCKIRSSSYHHLQSMSSVVQGHYLSDLVTMIGSQDIVLGEIDR